MSPEMRGRVKAAVTLLAGCAIIANGVYLAATGDPFIGAIISAVGALNVGLAGLERT